MIKTIGEVSGMKSTPGKLGFVHEEIRDSGQIFLELLQKHSNSFLEG
jgi:hypothetical protein